MKYNLAIDRDDAIDFLVEILNNEKKEVNSHIESIETHNSMDLDDIIYLTRVSEAINQLLEYYTVQDMYDDDVEIVNTSQIRLNDTITF